MGEGGAGKRARSAGIRAHRPPVGTSYTAENILISRSHGKMRVFFVLYTKCTFIQKDAHTHTHTMGSTVL